ncbi:hypothetical protein HGRIS_011833 [Hohenbuehelia grisea]|uniref:Uncharacterized protein n=1 Tax=Hohenbuehelia grisea TaxID=104357 RepID=A0ABR3JWA8_9AGAR
MDTESMPPPTVNIPPFDPPMSPPQQLPHFVPDSDINTPPRYRMIYTWFWEPEYFWDGLHSWLYGLVPKLRAVLVPSFSAWIPARTDSWL